MCVRHTRSRNVRDHFCVMETTRSSSKGDDKKVPHKTYVMNVKFTHGFILDRELKIVLISCPGRDRSDTNPKS